MKTSTLQPFIQLVLQFSFGPLFFGFGQTMIASLVAHVAYGAVLGGMFGRVAPAAVAGHVPATSA